MHPVFYYLFQDFLHVNYVFISRNNTDGRRKESMTDSTGHTGVNMDNKELQEMRSRLATLPVLKEKADKLRSVIREAEAEEKALLAKYKEESMDVERLKAESLSVYILKTLGMYEGKVNRETGQMLAAKMEYDKSVEKLRELKKQRNEIEERLAELTREKQIFDEEMEKREEYIRNNMESEASVRYRELENEQEKLLRQIAETNEALRAAHRVISTAQTALEHLDSAESWATYDVWFKSGIFSHIAKYDHIDSAEEAVNRLRFQMNSLRNELSDVNISAVMDFSGIDSTTRAIDFWFDNIFTDLSVRDKIREDRASLNTLRNQVQGIVRKLESNITMLNRQINDIESKKEELLIITKPE